MGLEDYRLDHERSNRCTRTLNLIRWEPLAPTLSESEEFFFETLIAQRVVGQCRSAASGEFAAYRFDARLTFAQCSEQSA